MDSALVVGERRRRPGCADGSPSSIAGQVVGSRPPGSAAPSSTSASALPTPGPGNQVSSTAGTSSAHGSSTGAPALTTTTVRGLAVVDAPHELVLAARQRERRAVEALALDLLGGPDDDDRDVGLAASGHGALELLLVGGVRRLDVELEGDADDVERGAGRRRLVAQDERRRSWPSVERDRDAVLGRAHVRLDRVGAGRQLELLVERQLAVERER